MARLCLTLTEKSLDQDLLVLKRYRDSCDLAELRCDCLDPEEYDRIASFPSEADFPLVLTCQEAGRRGIFPRGGKRPNFTPRGRSWRRGSLFSTSSRMSADQESKRKPPPRGVRIIRSLYDFTGIPAGLSAVMRAWEESGGDP